MHSAEDSWKMSVSFSFASARFTKMSRWWWLRINTQRLVITGWSYHGPQFPVWRLWPENILSSSNICIPWGKRWLQMLLGPANSASDWATTPFPAWGKPCGECWCILIMCMCRWIQPGSAECAVSHKVQGGFQGRWAETSGSLSDLPVSLEFLFLLVIQLHTFLLLLFLSKCKPLRT